MYYWQGPCKYASVGQKNIWIATILMIFSMLAGHPNVRTFEVDLDPTVVSLKGLQYRLDCSWPRITSSCMQDARDTQIWRKKMTRKHTLCRSGRLPRLRVSDGSLRWRPLAGAQMSVV